MGKRTYLLIGSALILLLTVVYLYHRSFQQLNQFMDSVNHTHEVITSLTELSSDLKSAEMLVSELGRRHNDALGELYHNSYDTIPDAIARLKYLVRDNKIQQNRLDTLADLYKREIKQSLAPAVAGAVTDTTSNRSFFVTILKVQRLIDNGVATERELLSVRRSRMERSDHKNTILGVILVGISLTLIAIISYSNIQQVSRRLSLESFLQSVLNTSQNPIITFEAIRNGPRIVDFRIIFANDFAQRKIPMASREHLGKTLLEMGVATIDTQTFFKFVRVTETSGKSELQVSFPFDGCERWYDVLLSKLNDGLTATFHDITELKNYQQELQHKLELLEHKSSELEQFAFVASHDLQEPLRKIKTFSSLINERFNEPSAAFARIYLNKVIHAADRMSSLISDLLNLSDLNNQKESYERTNLDTILDNVLTDLELVIEERSAIISREPLKVIDAIPMQMNQLFLNLLNNALKFSRKDTTPQISVSCSPATKEIINSLNLNPLAAYLHIEVRDNGIGFNPEFTQKIFVIFQRLNNKHSYSGSGIGLAICKKIVLNHRGDIFAEGAENTGASFHVILPEAKPANTTAA